MLEKNHVGAVGGLTPSFPLSYFIYLGQKSASWVAFEYLKGFSGWWVCWVGMLAGWSNQFLSQSQIELGCFGPVTNKEHFFIPIFVTWTQKTLYKPYIEQ